MPQENKKTKILYMITKSNWGGAQRYVFDLATNLSKDKFDVAVALGGDGLLKTKLEEKGIKTIGIPSLERDVNLLKEFKSLLSIYKIINNFKPNIIHLNSSKAGGLGAAIARIYNLRFQFDQKQKHNLIKIIFTAHGWAFKEKRKFLFKKMIEYSSWLTVILSHKTIVVSDDDKEKVKDFLFIQNKIEMIHNGIDQTNYKNRNESRQIISQAINKPISDSTFLIGSIAELHKNKGLEYAIGAYGLLLQQENLDEKIKNASYVIIGDGEEKKSLEEAIKREKLENNVYLLGQYNNAAELLKAFDLFLIPSLKEGLPYVLLEAGQAGLPIIATSVGGITEVVDDMKSGVIIREKRSKEIAECLAFLINHENKRKEFGEKIVEKIKNEYTLQKMLDETQKIYTPTA